MAERYIPPWDDDYTPPHEAGQGTIARRRRPPRMRVQDVAIAEASGLALGGDGYAHPLEVTADGELKAADRSAVALLEEILKELRRIREGLALVDLLADLEDGDDAA